MISAKLSGVTGTAVPVKMSWHVTGTVSPIVVWAAKVQPTAVLMEAVALELGVPCANAPAVSAVIAKKTQLTGFTLKLSYFGSIRIEDCTVLVVTPDLYSISVKGLITSLHKHGQHAIHHRAKAPAFAN
jgi:hypothetical protein